MGSPTTLLGLSLLLALISVTHGQPLVPAIMIFGDSIADVGNNNKIKTIVKANFPPYGRDFIKHKATGRFCNGKLALDLTAENLGFTSYPPAYLSKKARGNNLLTGANFASASSGYYDETANLYHAIPLTQQVEYYKEYQSKVVRMVGKDNATSIFNGSIYVLSAGSSDFLQNYYVNPLLYKVYTVAQFSNLLMQSFSKFVRNLYAMGARRIGVTTLAPMGCLPAAITLFGEDNNTCVERMNNDSVAFNKKLNITAQSLVTKLPGLKIAVFDIYNPLLGLIRKPADSGFFEARKACCGTGTIETSLLCNSKSPGTCANATGYVFWDSVHPSEATNMVLANDLLVQGLDLIS